MFNLFGRKTAKDFLEQAKETYSALPEVTPVSVPRKEINEYYRVGHTTDGETTLTLMANGGASMTLTMSPDACEQMIRMLRSTYEIEKSDDGS